MDCILNAYMNLNMLIYFFLSVSHRELVLAYPSTLLFPPCWPPLATKTNQALGLRPGVGTGGAGWAVSYSVSVLSCFSCVRLCGTLWTVARQIPLSMGFSRQEYRSALPFRSRGDLPDPGIEPGSPTCRQILSHLHHQGSP